MLFSSVLLVLKKGQRERRKTKRRRRRRKEKKKNKRIKGRWGTITRIDLEGNGSCSGSPLHGDHRKWNTFDLRLGFLVRCGKKRRKKRQGGESESGGKRASAGKGKRGLENLAEYHFFRSRKFSLFRSSTTTAAAVAAFSRV